MQKLIGYFDREYLPEDEMFSQALGNLEVDLETFVQDTGLEAEILIKYVDQYLDDLVATRFHTEIYLVVPDDQVAWYSFFMENFDNRIARGIGKERGKWKFIWHDRKSFSY